ncbi:hypothetical protein Glove_1033g32 [Diversispora epigaea]|uniref:Serine-threonine/tyrosine-protein kinase catalytic domain-containing protein n=1 Tax=Diversispora epigaea TaxID=1348612 RepID=A0A397G3S3_9GLOM|nr:hypothetical protein Glove_1033g32 [Diversispora epigaea]
MTCNQANIGYGDGDIFIWNYCLQNSYGLSSISDISHDKDLAMKICNELRPKIQFHTLKLITRMIMRCWDAHRPIFKELHDELWDYYDDYDHLYKEKNKDLEIEIQIKKN